MICTLRQVKLNDEIKEDEMGGECSTNWEKRNACSYWWKSEREEGSGKTKMNVHCLRFLRSSSPSPPMGKKEFLLLLGINPRTCSNQNY
jgi:hypothetical protein